MSGARALFDFIDDHLAVECHYCDLTNDPALIRENPRVTATNSAIAVDLTGQVCADSLGDRIFSVIGGRMDFIRGAALSKDSRPIIALPSMPAGGAQWRITHDLVPDAGVVATRGDVHRVVIEFGAVNLRGRTLRHVPVRPRPADPGPG